ncbi:hypothetical protein QJS04_geneDACA016481 [Acorus gramineus]|uniref:GBF-interacting protein 1 N-terminal domain-containing protein n=1 Tax=Acorus gramineus TaxID=55184 RepID=A0AAV9BC63_ACOGR|nr:hypothetical protein QJS04_geneDACA016481 [Acorus gramineus]
MASKTGGGGYRVSIPGSVRKTIQNLREITGNHSDEEIYAVLKECSMDPNETAQKLLLQDPFHEVKRKRDRKKENPTSKEPVDSRWRPVMQGRGGRGGRGNYSSRYISRDALGGRSANVGKENEGNQGADKAVTSSAMPVLETEDKSALSSAVTGTSNPMTMAHAGSAYGQAFHGSGGSGISPAAEGPTTENTSHVDVKISSSSVVGTDHGQPLQSSDPVLVPSLDSRNPGAVGTIRREIGSQRTGAGSTNKKTSREAVDSDISSSSMHGKFPSKSQGVEVNHITEASQVSSSSSRAGTSVSRPSSNYNNRSQLIGSQKAVGPIKEWKPKPTNPMPAQASGTTSTSNVTSITTEAIPQSLPTASSLTSEENAVKIQKKLEEIRFSERQHVIIPRHLQVPEAERSGLSFGSFDVNFGTSTSVANGPFSEKCSTPLSESSEEIEDAVEESSPRFQNVPTTIEDQDYTENPQSPTRMPQTFSSVEADDLSSIPAAAEHDQSKPEMDNSSSHQYSVVHTTPINSGFGLGQQPFDPSTSYYTQFYRPGADGDGRFSPFLAGGSATKFNGNIAVLPTQAGQSPQEMQSGNSLVLSTTGPTPLVTQSAGGMQTSLAVTQQPVPIFRQPVLSPYPPNYIPYNQYFSPFYVPQPTLHHFLSNTGFPQQSPTGGVFPPAAAPGTAVKYSVPQYKPGSNVGSLPHIGMPTGYGPYSSGLAAGYNASPPVSAGNSAGNEDLAASQYKENNVYITGQQSEGSAVWIPAPGRDMSGLQASSFYNLPPQGQHMAFSPAQAGHGPFAGIYHPTQTVAAATVHPLLQQSQTVAGGVEMVGPPNNVYQQQPQRTQVNWTNNY